MPPAPMERALPEIVVAVVILLVTPGIATPLVSRLVGRLNPWLVNSSGAVAPTTADQFPASFQFTDVSPSPITVAASLVVVNRDPMPGPVSIGSIFFVAISVALLGGQLLLAPCAPGHRPLRRQRLSCDLL